MTDGPTEIKDIDKTQTNKRLVHDFVQDVLRDGKVDKITHHRHNPSIGDGLDGLSKALESMAKQGFDHEVSHTK